ncbi:MAG: hypothetical protein HY000_05340, partial [Planctomycetes bacterium]|nr:hypothetical protein [Planctomycetota bacterium]
MLDADVNRNGVISKRDVELAKMNLGVSTRVRPLVVTVGLDPASDPDGDAIVNQRDVVVGGQTNVGATVRLDQGADGTFERTSTADATGRYGIAITAAIGGNPLRVEASDRFGQRRTADLTVHRSTNTAVTTDPGVQQMPSVAVDPLDPSHVVIAYMDRSLVTTGYAGIGVAVSRDGGDTWQHSSIPMPACCDEGAANPIIRFDDRGRVFVSFMAATFLGPKPPLTNPDFFNPERGASDRAFGFQANNGVFVARSDDGGLTWNSPVAVASHLYDGQNQVFFEVIPDLAIDTFRQLPNEQPNPNHGNVYVAWTRLYPPGQYPGQPQSRGDGEIMVAVSLDMGQTWTTRLQPKVVWTDSNGDGVQQEDELTTILVSVIRDKSFDPLGGNVDPGEAFRDQARLTVGPEGDIYVSNFASVNTPALASNHFRTHVVRAIVADVARPGHVYAVEPIRVLDSSGNQVDSADVFFARSEDHGLTWEKNIIVLGPQVASALLNDDNDRQKPTGVRTDEVISGQVMARISADAAGNIAVIWYDTRRDPANHLLDVFGTISTDGGLTFSPNFRITDVSFDADQGKFVDATGGENFYVGDFIGLALASDTGSAAWTDTRSGNQDIFFARFPIDPAPVGPNDRYEPNETAQSATRIGRVVQRVIPKLGLSSSDQDWLRVQASASGDLIVSLVFADKAAISPDAVQLELWDASAATRLAVGSVLQDESGTIIGRELRYPANAGIEFLIHVHGLSLNRDDRERLRYSLRVESLTTDLGPRAFAHVDGALEVGGAALYRVSAVAFGSIEVGLTGGPDVQGDLNLGVLDPATLAVVATG